MDEQRPECRALPVGFGINVLPPITKNCGLIKKLCFLIKNHVFSPFTLRFVQYILILHCSRIHANLIKITLTFFTVIILCLFQKVLYSAVHYFE